MIISISSFFIVPASNPEFVPVLLKNNTVKVFDFKNNCQLLTCAASPDGRECEVRIFLDN